MSISGWVDRPSEVDAGEVTRASIHLPPEIRRPSESGDHRLWVEFHGETQDDPDVSLPLLDSLLRSLTDLRSSALRLAPPEWRRYYVDEGGLGVTNLWLDAVEFDTGGTARLDFDFGDLDTLVLHIAPNGDRSVTVEQ